MLIAISIFTLGALGAPLPLDEQPLLFMGQWSHHIPVELPPAPRAMVPEVGISLSPSTQNGPIGMGWALDGVHRIERARLSTSRAAQIRSHLPPGAGDTPVVEVR